MDRIVCLLIGYLCGCFLTAEVVARVRTGKKAGSIGSGNPGAANMASHLGVGWGALTLLGDIAKTALACFLCRYLLFPAVGQVAILYAGLGAAVGHNYPFWNRFHGGKGIAVTCSFLVFFSPLWGLAACLAGLLVVVLSGYLYVGALAIPVLFLVPAFLVYGVEAGMLVVVAVLLMLVRALPEYRRIARGQVARMRPREWLRGKKK